MSQENVEIVRRVYEIWPTRQWSLIPDYFDSKVELDLSRNVFNPDVYRGHAGIEEALQGIYDMWEDFEIVPVEIIGGGDKVLATVRISGIGRESGVPVAMEVMNVWTIRDSKVVRVVGGYRDRAEALEAAGLSE
jgi:ketosteroid isomerase-like protein